MFCPNCGSQVNGGKFCPSCGNPLPMMPESALKEAAPVAPQSASPKPASPQASQPAAWTPAPAPQPASWENTYNPQPETWNPSMAPNGGNYPDPAPAQPSSGKKKMKPWLWAVIGGGAALLIAGVVLLIVFLTAKNDPTAQVAAAAAKSMTALSKTDAGKFTGEMEKSETKVSLDLSKFAGGSLPVDAAAELTLSQDLEAGKMSLLLSVLVKGREVADLGFYMDEKDMAVTSDTLLGKDAYGLTFETLPKDLKNSIFAPGNRFELPDEVFDILSQVDQSPFAMYKEGRGALKDLAEDGGKRLLKTLKEHAKITNEEGTFSVSGSKIDCKIVRAEADEEATRAIAEDLAAWLKESSTKEKLLRFFNVYAKIMNIAEGGRSEQDADGLLDDFYEELDDGLKDLEDSSSELLFYINKANGQLIGLRTNYESDKDEGFFEIAAGPDFENPEEIRFTFDEGDGEQFFIYRVTENSDSTYAFTIESEEDDRFIEFTWKKKRGNFTVSAEGVKVLEGKLQIEEDSFSVDIDAIGLSLELTRGADTEPVPKFINIVQLDEGEFEDLYKDIADQIQRLVFSFF
ncbi:MAG: zinc ribbon domain-containing protein [Lachnospiraceae bacterium]|nr:zinc ribbon domain-containing protein [Lachnospiraceae bacterium]